MVPPLELLETMPRTMPEPTMGMLEGGQGLVQLAAALVCVGVLGLLVPAERALSPTLALLVSIKGPLNSPLYDLQ